jgi:hypothetical protein
MSSRPLLVPALALLAVAGCGTSIDPGDIAARLRNSPPPTCTAEKQAACPAVAVASCPAGQEPVIDYSADCCGHFTCQPLCSSANRMCPMTPAPICPASTKLWIGTAIEDCCPAYRCQPDGSGCDPEKGEMCACDATNAACTLALPYCGPNVMPIIVGNTGDCCPIYQCPCDRMTDGTVPPDAAAKCGCTYPNCQAGEELVCAGQDNCMGPCTCRPARGVCKDDSSCGAGEKCDVSACRLPPMTTTATDLMRPECDPLKCGPQLGMPVGMCPGGGVSGPTGRCLLNADGTCGWEVLECPPAPGCYGICVPNVPQTGCQANTDCPMGQTCDVACREWSCTPGGMGIGTPTTTTTDPMTGMTVPPLPPGGCACDLNDTSCVCDASGACKGRTCVGQCVPQKPTCDPSRPIACPLTAQLCPNGQPPVKTGVNPDTCCPTYTCSVCMRSMDPSVTPPPTSCAAPACQCAKQTGTDPNSCCPTFECTMPLADGSCAR